MMSIFVNIIRYLKLNHPHQGKRYFIAWYISWYLTLFIQFTRFIKLVSSSINSLIDSKLKALPAFSVTCDAWTDSVMRKYISITYHAIDPGSFELISFTRDIIFLPESHSWWNITNAVRTAINSHFPGNSLLSTITTDNGSNFVKMSIALLSTLGNSELDNSDLLPDSWDQQVQVIFDLNLLNLFILTFRYQLIMRTKGGDVLIT